MYNVMLLGQLLGELGKLDGPRFCVLDNLGHVSVELVKLELHASDGDVLPADGVLKFFPKEVDFLF